MAGQCDIDGAFRDGRIELPADYPDERSIREWCISHLAKTLDMPAERISPDDKFARLGLDSASALQFVVELEEWLGIQLEPEVVDDHPTIAALARHLGAERDARFG
jgi:acyl carrier protein